MGEGYRARKQLVRLKWCVTAVTVGLITLLDVFYLTVVNAPAMDCLIEWVVVTGVALVLIHITFTVAFRVHDRTEQETCQLAAELAAHKRSQESVRQLAYHDGLTGLPNRALFNDRLGAALARVGRNRYKLAVMLMDLDHFEDTNDRLGHTAGDHLLTKVGERLTAGLRQSDTVCRMGGDQFLFLLPEVECWEHAGAVADRLLMAIKEPFLTDGHELHVTTSLGIALCPDDGRERDTLVGNADVAVYRVKGNGRDGWQRYSSAPERQPTS